MDDGLFQLVFLGLVLVGWIIRSAAEQRRRQEQQRRRPQPVPAPAPPPRSPPLPPPQEAAPSVARHAEQVAEESLGVLTSSVRPRLEVHAASTALTQAGEAQRRAALRRLTAGLDVEPDGLRRLVRAGILWSEVLGPCRGLRGPHVPPAFSRRSPRPVPPLR